MRINKKMKFMNKNQLTKWKMIIQYLKTLMMMTEWTLITCYGMLKTQTKIIWITQKCIRKHPWLQLNLQIIYSLYFKQEKFIETGLNLCLRRIRLLIWKMNLMLIFSKIRIMNKNLFLKITILISKMTILINKFLQI